MIEVEDILRVTGSEPHVEPMRPRWREYFWIAVFLALLIGASL